MGELVKTVEAIPVKKTLKRVRLVRLVIEIEVDETENSALEGEVESTKNSIAESEIESAKNSVESEAGDTENSEAESMASNQPRPLA